MWRITVGENSNSRIDSVMILLTLNYMRNVRQFSEIRRKSFAHGGAPPVLLMAGGLNRCISDPER